MRRVLMSLCAGGVTLLVASLSGLSVPHAQSPQVLSVEAHGRWERGVDVAKLYDAVVGTIAHSFFDEEILKKLDWRARAEALRPSVVSAVTVQDAVRRINELLSELKTSHTGLFTPDDQEYYILLDIVGAGRSDAGPRQFWGTGPYYPGIGAFTRRVEGRYFVDGILEGSPADRAGLKYGDEILSVDGAPYAPIVPFIGKISRTVKLEIRRFADAAPESLSVAVIPIRPTKAFSDATEASARVIERDGARIGYVHVWALSESNSFKAAVTGFDPYRAFADRLAWQGAIKGTGVIPDLRVERPLPYAGGADPVLDAAVELLAKKKANAP